MARVELRFQPKTAVLGLTLLFLMNASVFAAGVTVVTPDSDRYAILVGVDTYDNKNIPTLPDPSNDVKVLRDVLVSHGGFLAENITVLSTTAVDGTAVSDNSTLRPTRQAILAAISRLGNQINKNALLLFMFSGHGIARNGHGYLMTEDANLAGDVQLLEDTSLPVEQLNQRIADIGAKQAIVLLDACRNEPEINSKGLADNPLTRPFVDDFDFSKVNAKIDGMAVVFATEVSQRAYVDSRSAVAYFTEAVVDALSGGAADSDGNVSLRAMLQYVAGYVPARVAREMPGLRQNPTYVLKGQLPDRLIVSHVIPGTTGGVPLASANFITGGAPWGKGAIRGDIVVNPCEPKRSSVSKEIFLNQRLEFYVSEGYGLPKACMVNRVRVTAGDDGSSKAYSDRLDYEPLTVGPKSLTLLLDVQYKQERLIVPVALSIAVKGVAPGKITSIK